ncbi:MAG: undecaprenyl/decaprenyl-phosphate alpha-N-acetylglucosaminyl 1-phosphate transferase [Peptostreptococcaceae bacterium]|nr:undecaprenyl/decaprenyl-phosphate alpha-N-acetylglucosaminyl 1-phosphate transferase [Peptostreptococcaceae bacterium]
MSILYSTIGFLLGFILVYLAIPPIIRVSIAKHLYDTPNARKASKVVVPTLGGVAIFIGFILSTIIATDGYNFGELKYLIAAVILMFFVGLKDDLVDISALKKLISQLIIASMLIVLGNFRFTNLQGAFGLYEINYTISYAITLFVMIAIINAFNLIDGIDGLASGISILISVVFGSWFLLSGHYEYGIMCFSLTGSLIAFFIFNVFGKKHKIFMGDTGSLIIGVIMVCLVIKFNEFNINQQAPYAIRNAPVISTGILIIPIIDTLRVFFLRILNRRSPFSPDMNHIHHKFLELGNSHLKSTLWIVFVNVLFIGFTFALNQVLSINMMIISIFASGFILTNIPSLMVKYQVKDHYTLLPEKSEVMAENDK